MEPTLKQLKAFVMVYRLGTITRAAEQLFVTQSAVSVLLAQLEEGLGVRLFDRTTRSLKSTSAASELITIAERILRDVEAVQIMARGIVDRIRGTLVFASTPSVAASLLPLVLKTYSTRFPGISIQMHDLPPEQLLTTVISEQVEFSIGTFSTQPEGIEFRHLLTDYLSAIVPKDSYLASKQRPTWTEVLDHKIITVKRGQGIRELIDSTLAKKHVVLSPAFEVTYMSTALSMASNGLGIAVLPSALLDEAANTNLVARQIHEPIVSREIHLIHRSKASLSPAAEGFIEVWHEHLKALGLGSETT
ncbi:LysR family transcriptional regulator [Pseudomonas syringae]|uniref:LysR family transcriptional regulator n=1 Tax=Pseudomonas syringae TaxID=317 RepID=UPI001F299CE1|nr:LysR family transcriptional regulator [Pseudomonas syringae]MCF5724127.1 LysR family transcriptional regulator [Pseudomonas syringae]